MYRRKSTRLSSGFVPFIRIADAKTYLDYDFRYNYTVQFSLHRTNRLLKSTKIAFLRITDGAILDKSHQFTGHMWPGTHAKLFAKHLLVNFRDK